MSSITIRFLTSLICTSLLPLQLYSQIHSRVLCNFCACDYSDIENAQKVLVNDNHEIQVLSNSDGISVFRQFVLDLNYLPKLDFEFIRIEADTFLYIDYAADVCYSKVLLQGNVYFDSNAWIGDTIEIIDPDTYKYTGEMKIMSYRDPIRHGYWNDRESASQVSGHFDHGIKQGSWEEYTPDVHSLKQLTYENGNLVGVSEMNLVLTLESNNLEQVINLLTLGNWYVTSDSDITITFDRIGPGKRVKFGADDVMTFYEQHGAVKVSWKFNTENKTFVIRNESYQLIWLTPDYLELVNRNR